MHISPVQSYNYNYLNKNCRKPQQNQPSFGSNRIYYLDDAGKLINCSTTYFYRGDLEFMDFMYLLKSKYKWDSKVNIYNYGCSDCSEAYSLTTLLLEHAKDFAKKCFPIIAKDKEPKVLDYAQRGVCGAHDIDIYNINYYTNNKLHDYFEYTAEHPSVCAVGLKAKPNLREKIQVSQADVTEDIYKVPTDKNNVFVCRNMWLYIPKEKQEPLVQEMTEKARNKGLIVIGEHDIDKSDVVELLKKYDFEEIQKYVYAPKKMHNDNNFLGESLPKLASILFQIIRGAN